MLLVTLVGKTNVAVSERQGLDLDSLGKRKLSCRPKKRSKRYFGQSTAATAVPDSDSESESSHDEAPVSAAKRKLDVEFPRWIVCDSSSSCSSDSSSYSNPDSNVDNEHSSDRGDSESSASVSEASSGDDSPQDSELGSDDGSEQECAGYRLVYMEYLKTIVSEICVCKICRTGSLTVKETNRAGLASCIS